jgi:hypothetical protein
LIDGRIDLGQFTFVVSATVGLQVLLHKQAPVTGVQDNSTFANWTGMPEAIKALKRQ